MGLFDFMKSPEQKKKEELMKKLNSEIFPNGQVQMDREIQEVRELLGFRYSKEAIKETYVYASAIYYLSDDKKMEGVVSSILRNQKTSVTKDDAIRIFQYLEKKFGVTALREVREKLNKQSDSFKLFMLAKGGIVELKKAYKDLSDRGKFEVILLNSLLILQEYHEMFPEKYDTISDDYFELLFKQAADYGITTPPEKLIHFINARFAFYLNELAEQADNDSYLQTRVYSNFYVRPLLDEPAHNEDLFEYAAFLPAYCGMIGWVRKGMSIFQNSAA